MDLSLTLTPSGHLVLPPASPDDPPIAARLRAAPAWLLHLGWVEATTPLPPLLGFWRDFSRSAVTAFCSAPNVEELRDKVEVTAPADLAERALAAPPMTGAEYLNADVLGTLWRGVVEDLQGVIRDATHGPLDFARGERGGDSAPGVRGSVQQILSSGSPVWNVVGKVHLHLAENRRDPDFPFAFLATYTTGLTAHGKPQHRPLGDAVGASATARDERQLKTLLVPIQRAAAQSALIKELLDAGALFQPQRWSPADAHRFLREVPALEGCGVIVRVPDWWKPHTPPRPTVSVSIGGATPTALGLDALLDFKVDVSLEGDPLTAAELDALTDGLVLLKGRWVEIDRAKLDEVLAHWKSVQRLAAAGGVSFIDGMRLLAGAALDPTAPALPDDLRPWSSVRSGPWLAATLKDLRAPDASAADPGRALRTTLRPYQREGVQWLWLLTRLRLGACLADDMGLGKTVQLLALLLVLQQRRAAHHPHLLVAPASLIANWKSEAARFAPSLRLTLAHPSEADSSEAQQQADAGTDLVVTSYGTLLRWPWLTQRAWGVVVLDEAQAIKNPGARQTKAVKALQADARIALTGTPIENRLSDLWSLFDFLNPGLLGAAKQFSDFARKSPSYAPIRALTRPYLLRRLKTDKTVIADLPEKTELRAWCTLSKKQAALYQRTVDTLARDLQRSDGIKRRGLVLAALMRFKQICNHPSQWLGDGTYGAADSGKHARLAELCEVIASRQEKLLVFTQFREMTEPLARWLAPMFGRPGLVLSGATAVGKRQALVRAFQDDEQVPFFVLSLKAGGTGLNLTAASHVIHFDRWWNPAVEAQATDRAFRIGQQKNVLVHKFVCRGTIEERVDALLASKAAMAEELLGGAAGELKLTELDDAALLELVSLDLHTARGEA